MHNIETQASLDVKKECRLRTYYKTIIVDKLKKEFGYKNIYQVPYLSKITINAGLGLDKDDNKKLKNAFDELTKIACQLPVYTKAKKSVANFKIRENQKIGIMVTLRKDKMYNFLDKLITIALPSVRDFRGIPNNSFDGRGNYSFGIKEQLIFPEISYDDVDRTRGYNICFTTSAKTDKEAKALLTAFGLPFAKK